MYNSIKYIYHLGCHWFFPNHFPDVFASDRSIFQLICSLFTPKRGKIYLVFCFAWLCFVFLSISTFLRFVCLSILFTLWSWIFGTAFCSPPDDPGPKTPKTAEEYVCVYMARFPCFSCIVFPVPWFCFHFSGFSQLATNAK